MTRMLITCFFDAIWLSICYVDYVVGGTSTHMVGLHSMIGSLGFLRSGSPLSRNLFWKRLLSATITLIFKAKDFILVSTSGIRAWPSPAIESTLGDVQNRNTSDTKTEESTSIITSKLAIKFVKAAEWPTTGKVETTKKPAVKYAELYRKTTKRKRVKHGTSRSQNNTHKSFTPRPAVHKPYRPPMRPMRSNMNGSRPNRTSFYKPAHSYNKRPFQETTQNLVAILIQSVKRLERELKERTHIQKVDRGRSRPVMA
nr:hypothetical protein [Tanacetum cinerariifolium]